MFQPPTSARDFSGRFLKPFALPAVPRHMAAIGLIIDQRGDEQ